jgi:hypothetical protein
MTVSKDVGRSVDVARDIAFASAHPSLYRVVAS